MIFALDLAFSPPCHHLPLWFTPQAARGSNQTWRIQTRIQDCAEHPLIHPDVIGVESVTQHFDRQH
jgi:hypothetical protein